VPLIILGDGGEEGQVRACSHCLRGARLADVSVGSAVSIP